MLDKSMGRRDFIKGAAATGLVVAGAAILPGCGTSDASKSIKWDESADIVIIGSGFAACAAAIEALNAKATVKIIEKMPTAGGNSIINGGDFSACGTKMQKEAGIEDSPELMLKDMLEAGLYLNDVKKAKIVAESSNDAFEWAVNYLGAKFTRIVFHGGHSVPRSHESEGHSGSMLISRMFNKLKELGAGPEVRRKMERLIVDKDGRVIGIEIRDGYNFGDENSGTLRYIKANKAVILASGGFSRDINMRMIQDPRLTEAFDSTNHMGATGEALRAALKIGAMDVQLDQIQLGPWSSPDEKGFGYVPQFSEKVIGYGPIIDPATGKRFVSETTDRKRRADAMVLLGHPVIHIADSWAVNKMVRPDILEGGMKNGAVKKFNSLEEVASAYNIPLQPFLQEIARFNSFLQKGKDDDFNILIPKDAKPMGEPPFYVCRLWPKVHHCMGGLVVNEKGQVINQDFKPIKGLYAAGEVTGGTHGACRLGGVAMTDCVVFGRIAGQNAAKEDSWA